MCPFIFWSNYSSFNEKNFNNIKSLHKINICVLTSYYMAICKYEVNLFVWATNRGSKSLQPSSKKVMRTYTYGTYIFEKYYDYVVKLISLILKFHLENLSVKWYCKHTNIIFYYPKLVINNNNIITIIHYNT